ncbi:MAG: hypothetical protein IT161_15735 [Bryobacterales bacterium]|nr:hypothetical protein [Bryobacterales bacterium]
MPKSFNSLTLSLYGAIAGRGLSLREPRVLVRLVLGVLLVANLVAAYFVFRPLGGSVEELDREATALQGQIAARRASLTRIQSLAGKVARAKSEGDQFQHEHFLDRRTAYSTLVMEMEAAAKAAGVKARDHAYNYEPIEGSDTIGLLTVNGNYEGTYADLIQFVNQMDRSKRLIIMETLQAQPQQGSTTLLIALKMITFVKEDGSALPVQAQASGAPGQS